MRNRCVQFKKMNTPLNHHYVSRCHQKEFFNKEQQKIFIYDKELDNFYNKNSTKKIFSHHKLNSRNISGNEDHQTLEHELKVIEDDFPKNLEIIKNFLENQSDKDQAYVSLGWITMLGILGEMRHPNFKGQIDEIMTNFESDIYSKLSGSDKDEIKKMLHIDKTTPFNNIVGYMDIALSILEKMEPLDYLIFKIESADEFVLPDTSCFQERGQLKKYMNPFINEIVRIGIPLTPKIFVLATSKALKTNLRGIKFIKESDSDDVKIINRDLYNFSKKAVASKSDSFLRKTIQQIKNCP